MKRRNADSGKMRRPLKRTKITEGMYGNSMLYLKFVLIWATVVMADYMLEFRFEFLWPFWMMLRSVYDSFKYQGLAFSVFFICIALTSDMICFFFIPLQYIFFAASTYVWVQYVWFTFADKGICLPTVALCCLVVYAEGALRGARGGPLELWRPLAAHCVGYPALSLGFGVKAYVGRRLRLRRQRQVRAENEFYFQLMRDALPESALVDQNQSKEERDSSAGAAESCANGAADARLLNGSAVRRRCARAEQDGLCEQHAQLHVKLEKLEKHLAQQTLSRERDKLVQAFAADKAAQAAAAAAANANTNASASTSANSSANASSSASVHAMGNGAASGAGADEHDAKHDHSSKGSARPSRCEKREAISIREEKRKHKNKDKDKEKDSSDSHSHKSAEHLKEQILKEKEVESTKESAKSHKENGNHKEKERERDREMKEKEREREKEREKEQRLARECSEELRRARVELAAARQGEAEARRALAAAAASERQRRADHAQLRQAHAQLQHKVSAWRTGERATLERRLSEERRARSAAEQQLRTARSVTKTPSGECESEQCTARVRAAEAEASALRRDLQRVRERTAQLQRDLQHATDQVRALETRQEEAAAAAAAAASAAAAAAAAASSSSSSAAVGGCAPANNGRLAGALQALQERAAHLERSLSAETRVKLDLLSALGDAKRHMQIQEGLITRQEKELEELKAQMLAVMPSEYMAPVGGGVSKLRLSDGSPLDPNASVYTPKQLCSDA